MAYQAVFKRYELKYLLTCEQKARVLQAMEPHMELDQYGRTTIRNLYYDTDTYRLIRRSMEKPEYKEKLRIRSYSQVGAEDPVFVELKKKYQSVVYKRRISLPEHRAMAWMAGEKDGIPDTQIARELQYVMDFYGELVPKVFLSYEREAYYSKDGSEFRVTFDDHILCRQEDLSLQSPVGGTPILKEGLVLMEVKCAGGMPVWMAKILSEEHIYKISFSKYGTAYETLIFPRIKGETTYV